MKERWIDIQINYLHYESEVTLGIDLNLKKCYIVI